MMRKRQPYVAPKHLSGVGDQAMTGVGLYPDEFPVYMTHATVPSDGKYGYFIEIIHLSNASLLLQQPVYLVKRMYRLVG